MPRMSVVMLLVAIMPASLPEGANAAASKGIRFWNLTSATIAQLSMAPAGSGNYGPNQCQNDKDGTVSPDERLRITNTEPGIYDIKLTDKTGRVCLITKVTIEEGKIFTLEDKDLADCAR